MTDYIRGMEGRTRILPMQQANENRWHRAEVMFQVASLSEKLRSDSERFFDAKRMDNPRLVMISQRKIRIIPSRAMSAEFFSRLIESRYRSFAGTFVRTFLSISPSRPRSSECRIFSSAFRPPISY